MQINPCAMHFGLHVASDQQRANASGNSVFAAAVASFGYRTTRPGDPTFFHFGLNFEVSADQGALSIPAT